MIKIAITGNIASGKSCVEELIRNASFKVADADKINHEILLNDTKTINKIKELFKNFDIIDENGNISRTKLGNIVFFSPQMMKALEEILYKEISNRINIFFRENQSEKLVFVSAAMLFESGFYKDYDKIIFVSAKEDIRLKRLVERNDYSVEYAKQRINSQEKEDEKILKSDYVIYNNSDLSTLKKEVSKVLLQLSNLL